MEGQYKHITTARIDAESEKEKSNSMLGFLRTIVAEELKKDSTYNINTARLKIILEKYPDKFFGITEPDHLRNKLAIDMKDLRKKLGLPETVKRGF